MGPLQAAGIFNSSRVSIGQILKVLDSRDGWFPQLAVGMFELAPTGTATEAGRPRSSPQRPQFSLRALLIGVTVASVILALYAKRGLGTVPLSLGLLLSGLSWRGRLARLQTETTRPKLYLSGWLLVGMSLLLPSVGGCQTTLKGWEAAYFCAGIEVEMIHNSLQADAELEPQVWSDEFAYFSLLNLANLMFLLSPLVLWRLQRGKGRWLTTINAAALTAVWFVPLGAGSDYRVGYYVWCGGLTLLHLAHRLHLGGLLVIGATALWLWVLGSFH